jgi:hypothetical protein
MVLHALVCMITMMIGSYNFFCIHLHTALAVLSFVLPGAAAPLPTLCAHTLKEFAEL